jgi:small subunit ribosomal protein S1
MAMASLTQQLTGLKWTPLLCKPTTHPQKQKRGVLPIVCSIAISSTQNKERTILNDLFEDAYERCRIAPLQGVPFTLDQFTETLDKFDYESEIGSKVCLLFLSFFSPFVINLLTLSLFLLSFDVGLL